MAVVIDTSALVEWEKADWNSESFTQLEDEVIILPAIVWAEALVGVRLANSSKRAAHRRARLEAIRNVTGIEPFSPEIAEHYADIFAELHRQGSLIPQNDMAVAATARCFKCPVLISANDEAHFRRIEALQCKVI
ncbi:MAG: type II toxin-antitoxin system VapC family toxin [Puniceicoccales bacterium]